MKEEGKWEAEKNVQGWSNSLEWRKVNRCKIMATDKDNVDGLTWKRKTATFAWLFRRRGNNSKGVQKK